MPPVPPLLWTWPGKSPEPCASRNPDNFTAATAKSTPFKVTQQFIDGEIERRCDTEQG